MPLHLSSDPSSPRSSSRCRRGSSSRCRRGISSRCRRGSSSRCGRGIRSCCRQGPAYTRPPRAIGLTCDLYVWGQDKILGALLLVYGVLVVNRGPLSQQHRNILISNFSIRMTDLCSTLFVSRENSTRKTAHACFRSEQGARTVMLSACCRLLSSCSRHAGMHLLRRSAQVCGCFLRGPRLAVRKGLLLMTMMPKVLLHCRLHALDFCTTQEGQHMSPVT